MMGACLSHTGTYWAAPPLRLGFPPGGSLVWLRLRGFLMLAPTLFSVALSLDIVRDGLSMATAIAAGASTSVQAAAWLVLAMVAPGWLAEQTGTPRQAWRLAASWTLWLEMASRVRRVWQDGAAQACVTGANDTVELWEGGLWPGGAAVQCWFTKAPGEWMDWAHHDADLWTVGILLMATVALLGNINGLFFLAARGCHTAAAR